MDFEEFPTAGGLKICQRKGEREQRRGAVCEVYTSPQKEGRICVVGQGSECKRPGRMGPRSTAYTC